MTTGKNIADLVVILKTLPIKDAIDALASKLLEELTKMDNVSVMSFDVNQSGFDLVNETSSAAVRIMIATIMPNLHKLDPNVHLPLKLIQKHLSAIRHARWFEESANLSSVKVLIRVLKDVCSRFEGLHPLSPWMIDVLAHYSITFRNQQSPLPLNLAFKRVFQLLAGGIFLPGSSGIPDPCENGAISMHSQLSLMQQDAVCMTAQTLLRILSYGKGYEVILGLEKDVIGITTNMSIWDGVVVAPSTAAFELPSKDDGQIEQDQEEKDKTETKN